MNDITVSNYIDFFRRLDLKQKVTILKELTNELSEVVVDQGKSEESNEADQVEGLLIEELFGVWKDEDKLTEKSIINRTLSERIIDFD